MKPCHEPNKTITAGLVLILAGFARSIRRCLCAAAACAKARVYPEPLHAVSGAARQCRGPITAALKMYELPPPSLSRGLLPAS
jgi:hypothetical protein